jgi:acyl-[acyl carrier protein]--UDP-N-acetylglucosamine O-acyltransferase
MKAALPAKQTNSSSASSPSSWCAICRSDSWEALVGAGSLVTSDVPDYAIVYGAPATVRGVVPEEERIR